MSDFGINPAQSPRVERTVKPALTFDETNELYEFLQGNPPQNVHVGEDEYVKLPEAQAFGIIWYLQEHLGLIPTNFERCDKCGELYDSLSGGYYDENFGKNYCTTCESVAIMNGELPNPHEEE